MVHNYPVNSCIHSHISLMLICILNTHSFTFVCLYVSISIPKSEVESYKETNR